MSITCTIGEECGCNFKHTGASYPEVWQDFHRLIDKKVDCEECNSHGHIVINGIRDHIKAGIGKKPFDMKGYSNFVKEVNCVWDKCKSDGRCAV